MTIAMILKKLRINAGLSQKEFATILELDPASICLYEKGTRKPSVPNIRKIVNFARSKNIALEYRDLVEI